MTRFPRLRLIAPGAALLVALAGVSALPAPAIAQVGTADLAERPKPPVPKTQEDLMGGHGILMIILGLILLGLVIGTCLISPKRGHMD